MKKIELMTQPNNLEDVKEILNDMDVKGMTVSMVSGCGIQKGKKGVYRGTTYDINLLPKVKIEMVVKDEVLEPLIDRIIRKIRTGQIGDGKFFIYDVLDAIRIRTGEHGEEAI